MKCCKEHERIANELETILKNMDECFKKEFDRLFDNDTVSGKEYFEIYNHAIIIFAGSKLARLGKGVLKEDLSKEGIRKFILLKTFQIADVALARIQEIMPEKSNSKEKNKDNKYEAHLH